MAICIQRKNDSQSSGHTPKLSKLSVICASLKQERASILSTQRRGSPVCLREQKELP